ncbi:FAD/NAD(P)-binding protein [Specibacter sp. NPDC078692]|uniref:FAD/NAD(P)-binding protein n=1 Tax=Specibacter sp. NPDC078692 TaxID=3155818 RepID=UPI0034353E51
MIRIAVVGGGPKSLFALLALHDLIPPGSRSRIRVDVYDPHPPGSGSVWREAQPQALRLNVNAGIVDASSSLTSENFANWVHHAAPELSGEKYPPRALVGRYLREQFEFLRQHGNVTVSHRPYVVTGVERLGTQWMLKGPFGSSTYEEVLLATGHGLGDASPRRPPPLELLPGALNPHPLIGNYSSLTTAAIRPEQSVWIRGAALTAYDVALLLTEGRGGSWQGLTSGAQLGKLRYIPSGREPQRITFASRSGLLMDPKSETVSPAITACLERFKPQLWQWGRPHQATSDAGRLAGLWAILLRCAQECAQIMGVQTSAVTLWRTALTGVSVAAESGAACMTSSPGPANLATEDWLPEDWAPAELLRHSLLANHFLAPLTTGWLWARVWSGLYPELVAVMDRSSRSRQDWRQFLRVAGNLERFAFGPPELTARKLLALFDSGILHMTPASEEPEPGVVLIDAVTPSPGVLGAPAPDGDPVSGLYLGLLRDGHVSVRPGERGLLTDRDATCIASDGSRTQSLAAVGRPTEDPTLGHDTLNRSLHGEHRLWAQRIAGHVALNAAKPSPATGPLLKQPTPAEESVLKE